jgi:hypothetical protein
MAAVSQVLPLTRENLNNSNGASSTIYLLHLNDQNQHMCKALHDNMELSFTFSNEGLMFTCQLHPKTQLDALIAGS